MVERTKAKSTRITRFLKKLANESIPRLVAQEGATVVPQEFKFRRQSLPQPVMGFEFAKYSRLLDFNFKRPPPTPLKDFALSTNCPTSYWVDGYRMMWRSMRTPPQASLDGSVLFTESFKVLRRSLQSCAGRRRFRVSQRIRRLLTFQTNSACVSSALLNV